MSKLEVQRFLRGGGTLADLAVSYGIKAKVDANLGVVMLNYNQIASPMAETLCQECRALLLETGSWDVASRSFGKFFNLGEPNAHPIDWTTARVQEKLDDGAGAGEAGRLADLYLLPQSSVVDRNEGDT